MQLEALKATTDTKEVSFKIAYGLPISEMLRWGLYISGAESRSALVWGHAASALICSSASVVHAQHSG